MDVDMDMDNDANGGTSVQTETSVTLLLPQDKTRQCNRPIITVTLIFSVIAATFGSSSQFGFNIGVINNLQNVIRLSLNGSLNSSLSVSHSFTDTQWAAAVSILALGGMVGSLPAGLLADIIGRKWALLVNNAIAVVGVALQSLAVDPYMLIVGRFVIGVNAGLNTVLAPLYISEIAPFKYRGMIGGFHQLAITISILLSQILGINIFLGRPDNQFYGWRILLAFPLVFVIIQVLILPFCPESPKYLFIRKRKELAAEKALTRLCGKQNMTNELQNLQAEYEERNRATKSLAITDFISKPYLRRALIISIALHFSQQTIGIGAILSYSTQIFDNAGISNSDIATTVVGLVLLLGSCVTIVAIEHLGRRTLMLYGIGLTAIFFSLVSSAFCFQYAFYDNYHGVTVPSVLLVVFTLCVTFTFALGPGTIPWLMVSELFQQEARPFAVSVATIVNWLGNFLVGFLFPYMLKYMKPYPFVVFAFIASMFWIFMYFLLPETKGKTVDQITEYFKKVTSKKGAIC